MRKAYFITPDFESIISTANILDFNFPLKQLKMFGNVYYEDAVIKYSDDNKDTMIDIYKYYKINGFLFSAHSIEPINALELGDIIKDKKTSTFYQVIRADAYSCAIGPLGNQIDEFIESEDIH